MRILLTILLAAVTPHTSAAADLPVANDAACLVAKDPRPHVGRTLRFRAQFNSDYRHRSLLRPLGCDYSFKVDSIAREAELVIAPEGIFMGRPRSENLVVTVEGRVAKRQANSFQFQLDDGVRFDIAAAQELQVLGIGYPR